MMWTDFMIASLVIKSKKSNRPIKKDEIKTHKIFINFIQKNVLLRLKMLMMITWNVVVRVKFDKFRNNFLLAFGWKDKKEEKMSFEEDS